jgi:death-on-curing protein
MEDFGKDVVYPTADQIADTNRRMIKEFGGLFVPPDNLFNAGPLNYVLEVIRDDPDPACTGHFALKEKAARLGYHIISHHVFNDGNKRTGAHVVWEFLSANWIRITLDRSIIDLTRAMAQGYATLGDFVDWLKTHQMDFSTRD